MVDEEEFNEVADRAVGAIVGADLELENQYGGTALDMEAEYTVPTPVLGKLAEKVVEKMNDNEAEVMLANLKTVMES